jgi:enamine deaminase RidA (YjgF/YER057c/UK114 family)
MSDKSASSAPQPLLPVELGAGKIRFAQGMKAGRWVFATGLMAQDFVNGIAGDVLAPRAPHAGLPKREKEAQRIFENLQAVLSAAGTDRSNLVRTDQYYTTVKAVPPYQQVRREFLRGRIPPSTSITQKRLLLPDADVTVQAVAAIPEKNFAVEHHKHEHLKGWPTSGYSPALTVGDFIFIPGITSMAIGEEPRRNGVAAAALMAEGAQWGGQPIKLETEFIITQRIVPSLKLVGATLEDVAHAQIYLTDPEDYSAFTEVWSRHFGETGPTFSVIPCVEHGLAPYHGKIEINVLALKPGGAARKRHIDASITTALHRQPQALRARDLLFISGYPALWRRIATALRHRRRAIRVSRGSPRRRKCRRRSSSATSSGCAKPPAPRSRTSCASNNSIPTSASFMRFTKYGSAIWQAVRCHSRRSRCRRRCPFPVRAC